MLAVLWIFGIGSLKTTLVQEAAKQGGVFGQLIGSAIASLVTVGYGTYIAVIGGIFLFTAFFSDKIQVKSIQTATLTQTPLSSS